MNIKHLLTAAAATLVLTMSSVASAADANRDHNRVVVRHHGNHTIIRERFRGRPSNVVVRERFRGHPTRIVRERFRGRPLIARTRVVEVLRGRHIRFIGTPYFHGGRYVVRCYDTFGRLAYCSVDPYSGAFLGFRVRL